MSSPLRCCTHMPPLQNGLGSTASCVAQYAECVNIFETDLIRIRGAVVGPLSLVMSQLQS